MLAEAGELFEQGLTVREVGEKLGVSKSRSGRLKEAWDNGGLDE